MERYCSGEKDGGKDEHNESHLGLVRGTKREGCWAQMGANSEGIEREDTSDHSLILYACSDNQRVRLTWRGVVLHRVIFTAAFDQQTGTAIGQTHTHTGF